jgi:hypothetical protein
MAQAAIKVGTKAHCRLFVARISVPARRAAL